MSLNLTYVIVIVAIAFIGILPVAANGDDANSACPTIEEEIFDLDMLTSALHGTKAIGSMTKLRLRSDVNKVLRRIDAWHGGNRRYTLEQLQEQYDLLLMKIAALLQDRDLNLHQKLCNAWSVIWADLQDPRRVKDMRHRA